MNTNRSLESLIKPTIPSYMRTTFYDTGGPKSKSPRYKNQCRKLHTKGTTRTHHDSNHKDAGKVIDFNSYMGIDFKGKNAQNGVVKLIQKKNLDKYG